MKSNQFLSLLIIIVFTSCKESGKTPVSSDRDPLIVKNEISIFDKSIKPVTINVIKSNESLLTSLLVDEDHKIIKLETNDDCLIGEITKVAITGNHLFVLDSKVAKKLFCFDLSGKYLFSVGIMGDGPGEMDTPRDFDVTENRIFIIDRQCRLFSFDTTGKYMSNIRLPFNTTKICAFNDTTYFFYSNMIMDDFKFYLTKVAYPGNVESFTFPIQSVNVEKYGMPQAFSRNMTKSPFMKFLSDTIFTLTKDKIVASYVINFPTYYPQTIFDNPNELDKVFSDHESYWKLANMHLAETDSNLFFLSFGEKIYSHFYNKQTFKYKMFSSTNDDYMFGGLGFSFPVGAYRSYFIYPISMPEMVSAYSNLSKKAKLTGSFNEFKANYSEFCKLSEASSEDDNPALLLTQINKKIYE